MLTFTNHDHATAEALQEVMLKTCHGLCTWHLMQNGVKHLENLMKNGFNFIRNFNITFGTPSRSDFLHCFPSFLSHPAFGMNVYSNIAFQN